jgi:hypothetical protein
MRRRTTGFEEWGRRVDALVVEREPGLLYSLRGRTSEMEHKREKVPGEHFKQPTWETQQGFVVVYDEGENRQVRASYMPISIQPLRPGRHIAVSNREFYYDRDEFGAEKTAADFAAFLKDGTLPPRSTEPWSG